MIIKITIIFSHFSEHHRGKQCYELLKVTHSSMTLLCKEYVHSFNSFEKKLSNNFVKQQFRQAAILYY